MDYRDKIEATNAKNSFMLHNGIRLTAMEEGYARVEADLTRVSRNLYNAVHGGMFLTMADCAAGGAARSNGMRYVTVSSNFEFFHNTTRDLYYVGQSVRVVGRVTQHLTGHGNGDVYADLKYGDAFEISVVSLTQSGYESLDALERDAIDAFNAYGRGYNRTRGNRN